MLDLKNIKYYYIDNGSKNIIFEDLSFKIDKKEFVSLIGPSGCGKTTLVNIIAGYLKPVCGEVIMNQEKADKPGRDRIVINQENDLFNWMTVYDNMKLITSDEEIIERYLKLTDLVDYKSYYPYQLSGGMKKRLSLARALAADSEFIIMDEPFSSQDIQIKNRLHKELLKIIRESNKTILMVTHDLEEALFLSDRIVVLGGCPAKIIGEHTALSSSIKEFDNTGEFNELKNQLRLLGYNV